MKKRWLFPVCLSLLLLSGCASIYKNYQPLDRLRLIQTVGLDSNGAQVTLSVSSGIGLHGEAPLLLSQTGIGIEGAMAALQDYTPKDELNYAHVQYFLVSEEAAQEGIATWLDWFARSPKTRLDTIFFVVKDGTARELVEDCSDQTSDVTDRLLSLVNALKGLGQSKPYTVRDVASGMADRGAALCLAITMKDASDSVLDGSPDTAALLFEGLAIIQDNRLVGYINQDDTLAVQLLSQEGLGSQIHLDEVSMVLTDGGTSVTPEFDEAGTLIGVQIDVSVQAGLLEKLSDTSISANINQALAQEIAGRMQNILTLSQDLECDFLDLQDKISFAAPMNAAKCGAVWPEALKTLSFTIHVDAQLSQSYDLGL